jgi:hypothetical protein
MALDAQGNHIPGTLPEGVPTLGASAATLSPISQTRRDSFSDDRSEVNQLNNKDIFEQAHIYLTSERAQLGARLVQSFDQVLGLAAKLDHQFLQGVTDRATWAQGWEYNRQYDVANPVAVASGANITAGSVPANRITDTTGAVAGGAVNAGIAMSTLNNVSAQLGILQTMVDSLAQSQNTANTSIANVQATILGLLQKLLANPTTAATT